MMRIVPNRPLQQHEHGQVSGLAELWWQWVLRLAKGPWPQHSGSCGKFVSMLFSLAFQLLASNRTNHTHRWLGPNKTGHTHMSSEQKSWRKCRRCTLWFTDMSPFWTLTFQKGNLWCFFPPIFWGWSMCGVCMRVPTNLRIMKYPFHGKDHKDHMMPYRVQLQAVILSTFIGWVMLTTEAPLDSNHKIRKTKHSMTEKQFDASPRLNALSAQCQTYGPIRFELCDLTASAGCCSPTLHPSSGKSIQKRGTAHF